MKKILIAVVCIATFCTFISTTTFAAANAADTDNHIDCSDFTGDDLGLFDECNLEAAKKAVVSGDIPISEIVTEMVKIQRGLLDIDYSMVDVSESHTQYIQNWLSVDGIPSVSHSCIGTRVGVVSAAGDVFCRFRFSSGYSADIPEDANVVFTICTPEGIRYTIWEDGSHYRIYEQELEFDDKEVTEVKFDNPLLANWFYNCETQLKLREYEDGAIGLSFEDAKSAYILLFEEGLSDMPSETVEVIHRHWIPDEKRKLVIWAGDDGYHVSIIDHK